VLSGEKSDRDMMNIHIHLAPRLRMSGVIPLFLLYTSMEWTGIWVGKNIWEACFLLLLRALGSRKRQQVS